MTKAIGWVVVLASAACTTVEGERAETHECPDGETCSPKTPNGLRFRGTTITSETLISRVAATAIGGTQQLTIEYDPGTQQHVELDLPYVADDAGAAGVRVVQTTGPVVTVEGMGTASNYLRILDADDGTLFDRARFEGAAIASVSLVDGTDINDRYPPAASLVWAPRDNRKITVALRDAADARIVDTSMSITAPASDRIAWDTIYLDASLGTSTITVVAGDRTQLAIPFTVVDSADGLELVSRPESVYPGNPDRVCFGATNAGRFVVGAPWQFTVDGVSVSSFGTNCVRMEHAFTKTFGNVEVTAIVWGFTLSVTIPVAQSRVTPVVPASIVIGERARAVSR